MLSCGDTPQPFCVLTFLPAVARALTASLISFYRDPIGSDSDIFAMPLLSFGMNRNRTAMTSDLTAYLEQFLVP
jgi:hypothetical protein